MGEIIVDFKNVYLSFSNKPVLKDVSFSIYKKDIFTIAGPSGIGKSTILKLITGLLIPDKGEITVNADTFGMAFQQGALFNSMTVWENIALALIETTQLDITQIDKRVKEALETVNLTNAEKLYPDELSGGMQKRVGIARALALKPSLLLYDEPSTGLDPSSAAKLEDDMIKLKSEINVTSIVVTHDVNTIKKVSDRIIILDKCAIAWQGTKQEFMNDNSPYPLSFRERVSLNNNGENNGN